MLEFKGESGVSIRKGKKLVSFDYAVRLKWQCELTEKDGSVIAECFGAYEWPEISHMEEAEDWECRTEWIEDEKNLKQMLEQLVKGMGPKAIREGIVKEFVGELNKK